MSAGRETSARAELERYRQWLAASNQQLVSTTMALVRREAELELLRPRLLLKLAKAINAIRQKCNALRRSVWKLDYRVRLVAVSELKAEIPYGHYQSLGQDPYFLVLPAPDRPHPQGLVRIRFRAQAGGRALAPRLYVHHGDGMGEWMEVLLGKSSGEVVTCYARLPADAKALRLDPCEKPGAFQLDHLEVTGGGSLWTLTESLRLDDAIEKRRLGWAELRTLLDADTRCRLRARIGLKQGVHEYQQWLRRYRQLTPTVRANARAECQALPQPILISVLMPVFNPPATLLDEAIRSVREQLYPHWQLCIADDASTDPAVKQVLLRHAAEDPRIEVSFRPCNGHISECSNTALAMVRGEYTALLDHDDLLAETALWRIAQALVRHPSARLLYSDEDKIDLDGTRSEPYFKCDWNYDLFLSQNMVSHLGVYHTAMMRAVGGFRRGYEGSQDYDLALRCIETLDAIQIVHIAEVLYHWRMIPGSTALGLTEKPYAQLAGERALNDHLQRLGIAAQAQLVAARGHYRIRYQLPEPPLVSIVVSAACGAESLRRCLDSIFSTTDYPHYEVLLFEDDRPLADDHRIRLLPGARPVNPAVARNHAVQQAAGALIALLDDAIEVVSSGWLEEMASLALRPGVGVVGALLRGPDALLRHGGIILGCGGIAGSAHLGLDRGNPGYFSRAEVLQSYSAVSAACLLVRKASYQQVGGFGEIEPGAAHGDVDFCLRLREAGHRNVWTPYAELVLHSGTGDDRSGAGEETPDALRDAAAHMQRRWAQVIEDDPAYSPNLSLQSESFELAWPPRRAA